MGSKLSNTSLFFGMRNKFIEGIDFYSNIGFVLNFLTSWTLDISQFFHSLLNFL
jgi:hypothetical protein